MHTEVTSQWVTEAKCRYIVFPVVEQSGNQVETKAEEKQEVLLEISHHRLDFDLEQLAIMFYIHANRS